jgi:bifunctional non-homologous end joining protein LigD
LQYPKRIVLGVLFCDRGLVCGRCLSDMSGHPITLTIVMSRHPSRSKSGFVPPCLPRPAQHPPSGPDWVHEIKHGGFRILARRDERGVRLFTRNGYDFTSRFPRIADAINNLAVGSCLIDGEAIVVGTTGLSVFDLIRHRQHRAAVLCAFDLIELEGKDLRRKALEERKHSLANVLYREHDGIVFNQHYDGDGAIIFKQACSLGYEGIVSKRLGSPYRSGRTDHWLKIKNPAAPAVKRGAEEEA